MTCNAVVFIYSKSHVDLETLTPLKKGCFSNPFDFAFDDYKQKKRDVYLYQYKIKNLVKNEQSYIQSKYKWANIIIVSR